MQYNKDMRLTKLEKGLIIAGIIAVVGYFSFWPVFDGLLEMAIKLSGGM